MSDGRKTILIVKRMRRTNVVLSIFSKKGDYLSVSKALVRVAARCWLLTLQSKSETWTL